MTHAGPAGRSDRFVAAAGTPAQPGPAAGAPIPTTATLRRAGPPTAGAANAGHGTGSTATRSAVPTTGWRARRPTAGSAATGFAGVGSPASG